METRPITHTVHCLSVKLLRTEIKKKGMTENERDKICGLFLIWL